MIGEAVVFWDLESCRPPSTTSITGLMQNLLGVIEHPVTTCNVYMDVVAESAKLGGNSLLEDLFLSSVSLMHCPASASGGFRSVAMKMFSDIQAASPATRPSVSTIVIISNDTSLSYASSSVMLRKFDVVNIRPCECADVKSQRRNVYCWECDIIRTPIRTNDSKSSKHHASSTMKHDDSCDATSQLIKSSRPDYAPESHSIVSGEHCANAIVSNSRDRVAVSNAKEEDEPTTPTVLAAPMTAPNPELTDSGDTNTSPPSGIAPFGWKESTSLHESKKTPSDRLPVDSSLDSDDDAPRFSGARYGQLSGHNKFAPADYFPDIASETDSDVVSIAGDPATANYRLYGNRPCEVDRSLQVEDGAKNEPLPSSSPKSPASSLYNFESSQPEADVLVSPESVASPMETVITASDKWSPDVATDPTAPEEPQSLESLANLDEFSRPKQFDVLVEVLAQQLADTGSTYISFSELGSRLRLRDILVYANAGVSNLTRYLELAVRFGIIRVCVLSTNGQKIVIATDRYARYLEHPEFKHLVDVLWNEVDEGIIMSWSSRIGSRLLAKSTDVYKKAGVNQLKKYLNLAEENGIVTLYDGAIMHDDDSTASLCNCPRIGSVHVWLQEGFF